MEERKPAASGRWVRVIAVALMALSLSSCYIAGMAVMTGVAAGLALEEKRSERESRRREKRISKLPPDEQAVARLWNLRNKHGNWGGTPIEQESPVDGKTKRNTIMVVIHSKKKQEILEMYDAHFAEFGWKRLTPSANGAVRSYALDRYRVELEMETPSKHKTPGRTRKPDDFTDLVTKVYSPRVGGMKPQWQY